MMDGREGRREVGGDGMAKGVCMYNSAQSRDKLIK